MIKKRNVIAIISLLSIIIIAAVAVAITAVNKADDYERNMAANYRHAFSELVTGISEMDNSLQKSLLVTSPSIAGAVCTEIFAKAQTAEMALGVLPFSATELEKTAGFINRVGDYALSLSQKAGRGEAFSQDEKEGLKSLSETATILSQNLKSLQEDMGSSMVGIEEYARTMKEFDESEGEFIPQTLADGISMSEREFPELPSLIYDGPFSEHLKTASPKLLEGKEEIDLSQGRKIAADHIGVRIEKVYPTGEQGGNLPAFCYAAEVNGETVSVWVTKTGGVVYGVLNSRRVESSDISAEDALAAAKRQLEQWGYTNMKESYYLISNNVLTANFAYEQDGVVCYPDLIKVGIAMDTGSLQSFEAAGYVSSHYRRELPAAQVSIEQAREKVPQEISILSEATTVIPSAGKNEILCYEFQCEEAEGQKYIIYVNAVSGEQEKILILLEDESGSLTI